MKLQETAHVAEIERTATSLRAGSGLVLVHAPESQQAIDLTMIALSRLPGNYGVGIVDVTRCADDLALARSFAYAVASTYVGSIADEAFISGEWRARRDADLLALAEQTSPRFYASLTHRTEEPPDARELFVASVDAFTRRAADGPTTIAFLGAEELAGTSKKRSRFAGARDYLWTLRGRLQQSIGSDYVVFAGGARSVDLIASKDAAFYGWGTEVSVGRLPVDLLQRHLYAFLRENQARLGLGDRMPAAEATALAANLAIASDGSSLLAQQLLDVLPLASLARPSGVNMIQQFSLTHQAMSTLLSLNAERLRAQARLVKDLSPNALQIAVALASQERPYAVVQHPTEASRALTAMDESGIAVRVEGSRWILCDPLFASWLKEPPAGRLRPGERATEAVPGWALTS
jgi:hypothetical protein